jgi:hypothetical protein
LWVGTIDSPTNLTTGESADNGIAAAKFSSRAFLGKEVLLGNYVNV